MVTYLWEYSSGETPFLAVFIETGAVIVTLKFLPLSRVVTRGCQTTLLPSPQALVNYATNRPSAFAFSHWNSP